MPPLLAATGILRPSTWLYLQSLPSQKFVRQEHFPRRCPPFIVVFYVEVRRCKIHGRTVPPQASRTHSGQHTTKILQSTHRTGTIHFPKQQCHTIINCQAGYCCNDACPCLDKCLQPSYLVEQVVRSTYHNAECAAAETFISTLGKEARNSPLRAD
jgi:hypothetical protein